MTDNLLLVDGIQHPLHGSFHIVDGVVNDAVQTQIHLLALRGFLAVASGRTLKSDDNCVGSCRQAHIGLVDSAYAAMDNFTTTSSLDSFRRLCFTASTDPCTSAFTTSASSFKLPS